MKSGRFSMKVSYQFLCLPTEGRPWRGYCTVSVSSRSDKTGREEEGTLEEDEDDELGSDAKNWGAEEGEAGGPEPRESQTELGCDRAWRAATWEMSLGLTRELERVSEMFTRGRLLHACPWVPEPHGRRANSKLRQPQRTCPRVGKLHL